MNAEGTAMTSIRTSRSARAGGCNRPGGRELHDRLGRLGEDELPGVGVGVPWVTYAVRPASSTSVDTMRWVTTDHQIIDRDGLREGDLPLVERPDIEAPVMT